MKTTANFKLKKPDLTDVADIEVLNSNSDILDKIIKDLQNAQFTEQQARQIFALIAHRHNTSDINNLTTTIQQTKVNSAAYADNANKLDNLDSTDFMRSNKGDGTLANDLGVAQYLRWKNYGQHHIIFDASQGTTPSGRTCDRHNSENNYYSANCPNLMGWNGHQTYGLGVDRARTAEQVQGFQFRNNNGQLEVLVGGVWLQVGSFMNVNKASGNLSGQRSTRYMNEKRTVYSFSGKPGCFKGFNVRLGVNGIPPVGIYLNIDGVEFLCASWSNSPLTNISYDHINKLVPGPFMYDIVRMHNFIPSTDGGGIRMNFIVDCNFKNSFSILAHYNVGDNSNTNLATDCTDIIFYT